MYICTGCLSVYLSFADYSCALQKDILVHGRLYASQNYLCFYANIFRWETSVSQKDMLLFIYLSVYIHTCKCVRFMIVILQFWVTKAMNCQTLTHCMDISYVVDHK